jgi:glycosyltransferase involved in cell wall biosynthesis
MKSMSLQNRDSAAILARPAAIRPPRRRIAVIASLTTSLINFRGRLLESFVEAGHEVIAFGPEDDPATVQALEAIGIKFIQIPMNRAGLNPVDDLRTVSALFRHFRALKPDVVLPYTMKPIIFGCLAARLARVPHRYALITGLGRVFGAEEPDLRGRAVRQVSVALYRQALKGTERVFVYNEADAADVRRFAMIGDLSRVSFVPGSGVDLDHFAEHEIPQGPPTFLLIARLLRDKGIGDFAAAARILKQRHKEARFQLLGPFESNASALSREEIEAWVADGSLDYLGETRDVRPYLAGATAFVLPTYYREGIPRSILEALATGRAVITTDMAGCRETVVEGRTGFLVPPRDPERLAQAMETLILDPARARAMGKAARELARERFDVHAVNRLLLTGMNLV